MIMVQELGEGVVDFIFGPTGPTMQKTRGFMTDRGEWAILNGRLATSNRVEAPSLAGASVPGGRCRARLDAPVSVVMRQQKETAADPSSVERESSDSRRPADSMFRVMLVDDHEVVRDQLAGMLRAEEDIQIVAEAATGEEALELLEAAVPDVVVMDVTMPGMGGVEATRQIVARLPDVRVVGLSMHRPEDVAAALHEVGAAGYVRKGAGTQALVDAIRNATHHS